jgi:LCP family protein required for cell wall assembly
VTGTTRDPLLASASVAHFASEAAARPIRRWPRRVLIASNVLVAVCLLGVGSAYAYFKIQFGTIKKVHFGKDILRTDTPGNVMNVLVVGSDSRSNITSQDCVHYGCSADVSGQRSDTIMILHVDPRQKKAAILSIPRDLWVPIYDASGTTTHHQRINTAFDVGPEPLIKTITQNLGIPIDHYAEVDFVGFQGIVNAIGGVSVYFPAPARDTFSGLNIAAPGCFHMDGRMSLAYVRSRHYEYYESGRWHFDPNSDFSRIARQQDFIHRVMKRAVSTGLTNPLALNRLVTTGVHYITVDSRLSANDMLTLAKRFRSLSPDAVDNYTLPTTNANVGGAAVLFLKQAEAQQMVNTFLGLTPSPTPPGPPAVKSNVLPGSVRVRVLNGAGTSGLAGKVGNELQNEGFAVSGRGDADNYHYVQSVIRYGASQQDKANLLQSVLIGGADLKADPSLVGSDLVLVVGSNFGGVQPVPGSAATSTTQKPGATTTTVPPTTTTLFNPTPGGGTAAPNGQNPAASC